MKKSNKSKWIKLGIFIGVVAVIGIFIAVNRANATAGRFNTDPQTIMLERTNLARLFSASGVVQSADTTNVFSPQQMPVLEIFVEVGDRVQEGDILARLDMSRFETDLEQAELNLLNAQVNATEETRANANAVQNARTSVESSRLALDAQRLRLNNLQTDLAEAETEAEEPFDSFQLDRAIEDARLNVERRQLDLDNALQDLDEAINDFDGFALEQNLTEARIRLERAQSALEDAEADLAEERRGRPTTFENSREGEQARNAVSDAERALRQAESAAFTASDNLSRAETAANLLVGTPEYAEAIAGLAPLRNAANTAWQQVENARVAYDRARTSLTRTRNDFNSATGDARDATISALETRVETAQNAAYDAERAYDRAQTDLERGQQSTIDAAEDMVTRMENNLSDAIRSYERLLLDLERAKEDYIDMNQTRLQNNRRTIQDTRIQVETAQNNLRSAQNTLNQAEERPAQAQTNIELQELNIERIRSQIAEGYILATASGMVTDVNTRVGAPPSGILFVIEDVDNLLVHANVREHSLNDLFTGQPGFVTTVATGNIEYDAALTFISPRSISPAGSTSVEFEIRAAMSGTDENVRIGMNAFLNIILDSVENVFVVPLSAIITDSDGTFVYIIENSNQRRIPVTVGLRTTTQAEVSGNLHEGMEVLVRPNA